MDNSMNFKDYPVYDYLLYLWKKKWIILAITILGMGFGFAITYFQQDTYKSTALIFTGNAKNDLLTKPMLIEETYKEQVDESISASLDATILEPFHITLSLTGSNQQLVQENLESVSRLYTQELLDRYTNQSGQVVMFQETLSAKLANLESYNEELKGALETTEDVTIRADYLKIISENEVVMAELQEDLFDASLTIEQYEEPQLMSVSNQTESAFSLITLLLVGLLSFQIALVYVVLKKYLLNAQQAIRKERVIGK